MPDAAGRAPSHIAVLDGWRALSILLVLFAHWFPTPRAWELNAAAGAAGMALFFTLSGFLITQVLLKDARIAPFLIRRLCRILPLAWAAMAILALATRPDSLTALANVLFFANLPPARLMEGGHHLWSLCLEVQFYAAVALLVAIGGRRALYLLPVGAVAVTALRVIAHQPISIVTWHRLDEILAGATAALIVHRLSPGGLGGKVRSWHVVALLAGLMVCSHPASGALQYGRPYLASLTVLVSIYVLPGVVTAALSSRPAVYVARISYALYVVHGMLTATWLGGESLPKMQRYLLRPVLAAATFALAHLSTFYYEKRWTDWGKRLTRPRGRPALPAGQTVMADG